MFSSRSKKENFPTSPPAGLVTYQSSPMSVALEWDTPTSIGDDVTIEGYKIVIQCIEGEKEILSTRIDNDGEIVTEIDDLDPETEYLFSVTALCSKNRESAESDTSEIISTGIASKPPGRPTISQTSATSVLVKWTAPGMGRDSLPVVGYKIMCEETETGLVTEVNADVKDQLEKEVGDLHPESSYKFTVKAVCSKGESSESEPSEALELMEKVKDILLLSSKILKDGFPGIYQLIPTATTNNKEGNIRKCQIGYPVEGVPEKVVMVVGATGAGKTTLINGMINFIVGVEWNDKFRFKLIADQEEVKIKNMSKSQTQWITSYTIHYNEDYQLPYTLTVIDTPGFGDTSGIKRDKEITDQINTFFSTKGDTGIDHIDAIGFVVQSALPRLTPIQVFIFDSILSLFGNDIAENIYLMVTYGDGGPPAVLAGIKEANLPYQKYFKFNNSALFANNGEMYPGAALDDDGNDIEFTKMFWEMGEDSYRSFFTSLNSAKSKSLQLTQDVLQERLRLETYLKGIQMQLHMNMTTLEKLRTEQHMMRKHENDIHRNRNFTYTVQDEIMVQEKIPKGSYTTNCLRCNFTCHYPCYYEDKNKEGCVAMTRGYCTTCPKRCYWDLHKNTPYKFVIKRITKTKNYDDLKKRYENAEGMKMSTQELLQKVTEEFESVQIYMLYLIGEMKVSLESLNKIAMKPDKMSHIDLVENLIQSEEKKHDLGWQDRARMLKDVKRDAHILFTVSTKDFDSFDDFKEQIIQKRGRQKYRKYDHGTAIY